MLHPRQQRHSVSSRRGFSLIESIIYVSILAVILVVIVNTILISIRAFSEARVTQKITAEGRTAMERMLRSVRLAHTIDTANSILATTTGTLALTTVTSPADATEITRTYSLSSGTVMLQDAILPRPLTSGVEITELAFYAVSNTSTTSEAVRIQMRVRDTVGRFTDEKTFYGTATLRGSY